MVARIFDQSASEQRLHRAHYVIIYLRALIIQFTVILIIAALYFLKDIRGLNIVFDDIINYLTIKYSTAEILYVSAAIYILMCLYFSWIYFSVVKVWKFSLRFHSIYFFVAAFASLFLNSLPLYFSFIYLSTIFSVLAVLNVIFAFFVVFDTAVAFWSVSRSPEKSSFIAALDSRLTSGFLSYINRLLDLPRTPLHNIRVLISYFLTIMSMILLVISTFYLLSFIGIQVKLSQLVAVCNPENMGDCLDQSWSWSWEILLWILLSCLGVGFAGYLKSFAQRLGGLSVSDVLRSTDGAYILYLRPFDTDDVTLPRPRLSLLSRLISFRPFPVRIEEVLFDVADGHRPLIAVGKPGTPTSPRGGLAYRSHLDDADWQRYVIERIRGAESVVIVLKDTDGVRWELSRIIKENAAMKTLFLFDPAAKDPGVWSCLANMTLPRLKEAGIMTSEFMFKSMPIGFYFENQEVVQISNENWTTTSYRTAFSFWLAQRATHRK